MTKVKAERGCFSSSKKMEAVPCVLRDEDLDVVSREVRITAARFSAWRDQLLTGGRASLKSRVADGRDEELARLKTLVGDLTMRNEVLREGLRRAKEALPLALRRLAS